MPKLASIRLRGRSGREYDFRVYIWGHQFKAVPAVYAVMERRLEPDSTVQYFPIYVGETADLSHALRNNPREECFQVYLANTIAVRAETDTENRKKTLLDLLAALEPPCNQLASIDI